MPSRSKLHIRKTHHKTQSTTHYKTQSKSHRKTHRKTHRKQHNKHRTKSKNNKKRLSTRKHTRRNQHGGFNDCSLATVQEPGFTIPAIGDVPGFSLSQSKGAIYRPNCKTDTYQAMTPA